MYTKPVNISNYKWDEVTYGPTYLVVELAWYAFDRGRLFWDFDRLTDDSEMGGWQSTSGSANKTVNMPLEYNNNDGDTVIIPVDASQQAEAAFLCK